MYSETAIITRSNVLSIIYLAKKYLLDELSKACVAFLGKNLSVDDVCTIVDQSITYDEESLTKKCVDFVVLQFADVLRSDTFLDLSNEALTMIAKSDYLVVENELVLYRAMIRWAKNQFRRRSGCDLEPTDDDVRVLLGDLVYRVRFQNVEANDLSEETDLQILAAYEKADVLSECSNKPSDARLPFDTGPRAHICSRFTSTGVMTRVAALPPEILMNPLPAAGTDECYQPLCVQTDKDIEIVGFFLFGVTPDCAPVRLDFDIQILGFLFSEDGCPLGGWGGVSMAVGFDSDGGADPHPVLLPEPVVIRANEDLLEWKMFNFRVRNDEQSSSEPLAQDL